MDDQNSETENSEIKTDGAKRVQRVLALIFFILGAALCVVAISLDYIGLDITPGFGAVQMLQFLLGVSCLTLAVFLYLHTLRQPDVSPSLQADIGMRLAATGLVFMYVAGFSDLIGIGTHVHPTFARPFVGPLQLVGIFIGALSIITGMLLYHTSRKVRGTRSSMEFLMTLNGDNEEPTVQN